MNKKPVYILMSIAVAIWGLDYTVAKNALETLDPLSLLFYKYIVALTLVLAIRLIKEKGLLFRKKDIGLFIVCAIFGDIMYFFAEYTAMDFMPISLITIVLAFVPAVSLIIDRFFFKRRAGKKAIIGVLICIVGVSLIIGVDWQMLLTGRLIGYLLAFTCVISWNIYNFVTASLHDRYTTVTLTLNQLICVCLMLLPYVLNFSPPLSDFTPLLAGEVLYLGLLSGGVGFLVQVRALHVLGPTTTALFSNFLPVTATFFGWLILGETIAPLQIAGGAIIISAAYVVIKEMGKANHRAQK